MKLPFNNPRPVVVAIVIFLIVFFWAISQEADADVIVEGGAAVVSGEFSETIGFGVSQVWGDKWSVGLMLIGEQTADFSDREHKLANNFNVNARRLTRWKRLRAGLGVAYWQNTNRALGCRLTFDLYLGFAATEKLDVGWRHWSNAGTCKPNSGQDLLAVGWRF